MKLSLDWSELADQDIEENLAFLEREWGRKAAENFLDRLDEALEAVQANPATYLKIDKRRGIHKFVLNKHITLYYQLTDRFIHLITFWNSRKDPGELKRLLK